MHGHGNPVVKVSDRGWHIMSSSRVPLKTRHVTRFTHGTTYAEGDGIQRLPHRWQRVVTEAGDYIEGL
ncbi:hypothetical protein TNCV_1461 [Trichonephila clavipes]|nr:hypothetical protein TNCV_1461 [Trichonephila clavipes]